MQYDQLVSIIIPIYNAEKYLKECLDSVINQTHINIEIICINDGSTDSSLQILEKYEKEDSRIKIINHKNFGVSKTRNIGINIARGNYIFFIDADDKIESKTIKKMLVTIIENDSDIVVCMNNLIDKNSKERKLNLIAQYLPNDNIIKLEKEKTFEYLYDLGVGIPVWNKLIKKDFLLEHNILFDELMSYDEDLFFNWTCILYAKSINIINEPLYKYRLTSNSAIMRYHENLYEKYKIEFENIMKIMKSLKYETEYIDYVIDKIFEEKIKNCILMICRSKKKMVLKKRDIKYILDNSKNNYYNKKNKNIFYKMLKYAWKNKNINMLIFWGYLCNFRNKIVRLIK